MWKWWNKKRTCYGCQGIHSQLLQDALGKINNRLESLERDSHPPLDKKYDEELAYEVQVRILRTVDTLVKRIEALETKCNLKKT